MGGNIEKVCRDSAPTMENQMDKKGLTSGNCNFIGFHGAGVGFGVGFC